MKKVLSFPATTTSNNTFAVGKLVLLLSLHSVVKLADGHSYRAPGGSPICDHGATDPTLCYRNFREYLEICLPRLGRLPLDPEAEGITPDDFIEGEHDASNGLACQDLLLCYHHGNGCRERLNIPNTCATFGENNCLIPRYDACSMEVQQLLDENFCLIADYDSCPEEIKNQLPPPPPPPIPFPIISGPGNARRKLQLEGFVPYPDCFEYIVSDSDLCRSAQVHCQYGCLAQGCQDACVDEQACGCHDEGNICERIDICRDHGRYCDYECTTPFDCKLQCDASRFVEFLQNPPLTTDFFEQLLSEQQAPCQELARCLQNPSDPDCAGKEVDFCSSCNEYCQCECRGMECRLPPQEKNAGMGGDPHVKSWSGERFDFHGECDLVLLQVPNLDGPTSNRHLIIHARTTRRFEYSYIESVAVFIGNATMTGLLEENGFREHDGNILEVSSFGQFALDGINNANLSSPGASLGGYLVSHSHPSEKEHVFDIMLAEDEYISIATFKDLVSMKLHIPKTASVNNILPLVNSRGIMGNYTTGRLIARDGITEIQDHNQFGQEWQVLESEPKLFLTNRSPQHPTQCIMPDMTTEPGETHRRLRASGVTIGMAKEACNHLESSKARADCEFDVLSVGDLDIAKTETY